MYIIETVECNVTIVYHCPVNGSVLTLVYQPGDGAYIWKFVINAEK